jgi:hypothetical protein
VNYNYKGFAVNATARQINYSPNEVWRPLYSVNGKDQSQAWTPSDLAIAFTTEQDAIEEARKRAEWTINNSGLKPR